MPKRRRRRYRYVAVPAGKRTPILKRFYTKIAAYRYKLAQSYRHKTVDIRRAKYS